MNERTLPFAPDLSFPVSAVTQRFAFLGRIGTGKTYALTKLMELMLDADAQVVGLDPVGKMYGLRVPGTGPGYAITIFGGLHGDVPLEPTGGALIADLVVDRTLSCVIDVSQFASDAEKARFAAAFADRFYRRKSAQTDPTAVFVALEECQEFIPQNIVRGGGDGGQHEKMMLHYWTRLAKLGRNSGIGLGLASQRPQEVNKKVLNLTECMVAFQLRGKHERQTVRDWVTDKDADATILDELPKLPNGVAWIDSPQWLGISRRVKASAKRSADVSATPTVGAKRVASKPLTDVDIGTLREAMAATIEKAKADDPKELRKQLATLRTELTKAQKAAPAKTVERSVVDERATIRAIQAAVRDHLATITNLRKALEAAMKFIINISAANFDVAGIDKAELERAIASATEKATAIIDQRFTARAKQIDALRLSAQRIAAQLKAALGDEDIVIDVAVAKNEPFSVAQAPKARPAPARPTVAPRSSGVPSSNGNGHLSGARLKIARGLAELEAIGVAQAKRAQLSFYAGLSFAGGYGSNTLGAMRTDGLVDYPTDGYVALTADGRKAAGEIDPPTSLDDLHDRVRRHLSGLELRIFDAVVALGEGGSVTREDLGETIGASFAGGYGSNTLGALRTAGLVEYPEKGTVGPSDLLFPEGLS